VGGRNLTLDLAGYGHAKGEPVILVHVRDESPTGAEVASIELEVDADISLRELIRTRVRDEVARYNANPTRVFRGLVEPIDAETTLNGYRLKRPRRIDWEKQADAAIKAFAKNGFFVLVGGRQIEDLDTVLTLGDLGEVAFVRIVPLVGG